MNIRRFGYIKTIYYNRVGVNGPFEAKVNNWGAKIEPTNGFKAKQRQRRYKEIIEKDTDMCFGSYCFLWGQKQESTSTFNGMYLSNGNAYRSCRCDAFLLEWLLATKKSSKYSGNIF